MARRSIVFAVAALLVLALAPVASADEHGTHRPIWSNQSGEVNFHMVGVPGKASRSPKVSAPVGHWPTHAGVRPSSWRWWQNVHLLTTPALASKRGAS